MYVCLQVLQRLRLYKAHCFGVGVEVYGIRLLIRFRFTNCSQLLPVCFCFDGSDVSVCVFIVVAKKGHL